ncbi:MAG TPA: class I SAM-dependent methyltransferase [Candidatus Babeliales bacterium]|nr:class I SAM-dependent methyltransferase [Candidatus Babeliales bacterium]
MIEDKQRLKRAVHTYWNNVSCGTECTKQPKYSSAYFEEIEQFRYTIEPHVFSFAQFTRFHGKKVLEVGIGSGTDFIQWVRAGAHAYGIDLTKEAVDHVFHRLLLYNLRAYDLQVADAEQLPYEDNFFDLVYSWGVMHHCPDPVKSLQEMIRVTRPGGTIKLMIYNRRSLYAWYKYLQCGLFQGRPLRSIKNILYYNQESLGTTAYTFAEIKHLIADYPVTITNMNAAITNHDLLYYKKWPYKLMAYIGACILGWHRAGWFMTIELKKNRLEQEH